MKAGWRRLARGAAGCAVAIRGGPIAIAIALTLAAGLASFAAATPAAAATRWYRVEVVVFAQGTDDEAWGRDDWREDGPPALAANTVELLPGLDAADLPVAGSNRPRAFRTLPASALAFGAAADRLDGSNDHRVLLHVGWDQPGFSDDEAPAVHLGTLGALTGAGERAAGTNGKEVEGSIRFWRRRFLHVDVDLSFGDIERWREQRVESAPAAARPGGGTTAPGPAAAGTRIGTSERPPAEDSAERAGGSAAQDGGSRTDAAHGAGTKAGEGVLRVTRLTRSLRLRSGRLHYIDHPVFGVLLAIRRLYPSSR